jgi:hypothetical protein
VKYKIRVTSETGKNIDIVRKENESRLSRLSREDKKLKMKRKNKLRNTKGRD